MRAIVAVLALGCAPSQDGESPDAWYDQGAVLDVEEPLTFTAENYAFPEQGEPSVGELLSSVFPVDYWTVATGADDQYAPDNACDSTPTAELPYTIEGVVTIYPRFYFKTSGCTQSSDEKYYGSFFIQDRTGGIFVLGDSKVAHFSAGDKVKLLVRAAKTSYDLNMVYTHDVLEIDRSPRDVYYEVPTGPLGDAHVGKVQRVTGEVATEPDTFGEFTVTDDSGQTYTVGLDTELNRRGVRYDIGTRVEVTGPVLYSYSTYGIVIMDKGQITVLDSTDSN